MSVPDVSKLTLNENKENQPPPKAKQVTPEKSKFASPPPTGHGRDKRDPLSPKKGFAVNTKHMPAYMRPTSSSGRKTITSKLSFFGFFYDFVYLQPNQWWNHSDQPPAVPVKSNLQHPVNGQSQVFHRIVYQRKIRLRNCPNRLVQVSDRFRPKANDQRQPYRGQNHHSIRRRDRIRPLKWKLQKIKQSQVKSTQTDGHV